jgi:hypothetical protein
VRERVRVRVRVRENSPFVRRQVAANALTLLRWMLMWILSGTCCRRMLERLNLQKGGANSNTVSAELLLLIATLLVVPEPPPDNFDGEI